MKQISAFIENNYGMAITDIRLLDSHFGTDIYKVKTDKSEYMVKAMLPGMALSENEGMITEYLS